MRRRKGNVRKSVAYKFVDFYRNLSHVTISQHKLKSRLGRVYEWLQEEHHAMHILLALLGIVCALIALGVEYFIRLSDNWRNYLANEWSAGFPYNLMALFMIALLFSILAVSCVQNISHYSMGSGVPEMKSILGGVSMDQYLTFRTLMSKCFGLMCVFGAGLFAGKEGVFVHIGCGVCSQLLRLPVFERLRKNDFLRIQMLATAGAAGIAGIFGAPIGGVLFSIEVTAVYYDISNLWRGIYSATCGAILFYLTQNIKGGDDMAHLFMTHFPDKMKVYSPLELIPFSLLGIALGLYGAFFISSTKRLAQLKRTWPPMRDSRYGLVMLLSFITLIITFPLPFLRGIGESKFIRLMLLDEDLPPEWQHPHVLGVLIFACALMTFLICLTIVLPIPVGLFAPVFLLGAILGRIFGELSKYVYGSSVIPGVYAAVGAAGMASAVTGTLSTSVITFEALGQINFLLPTLLVTVLANGVSYLFNTNVFDSVLRVNRLPLLSTLLFKRARGGFRAADQMISHPDIDYLTLETSSLEGWNMMEDSSRNHESYPVVASKTDLTLIGSVQRSDILDWLMKITGDSVSTQDNGEFVIVGKKKVPESVRIKMRKIPLKYYFVDHFCPDEPEKGKGRVDDYDPETETDTTELFSISKSPNFVELKECDLRGDEEFDGIEVDVSPFMISEYTPYTKIHFVFSLAWISHAFVVSGGKLVGVITKRKLL